LAQNLIHFYKYLDPPPVPKDIEVLHPQPDDR